MQHLPRTLTLAAFTTALLTACGGGGDAPGAVDILGVDSAPGFAADGATMPVNAAGGLESAADLLENALGDTVVLASGRAQPLAVAPQALSGDVTAACPGGGSITWSISGANLADLQNQRFDTGETYSVSYDACTSALGDAVLNGQLTLVVVARSETEASFTLDAVGLDLTTAQGQHTLDGSAQSQRVIVANPSGGFVSTHTFSANALRMATRITGRTSSYQLNALDWNVVRTWDANGVLLSRSQSGSVDLAVNTPLRPAGSLQVSSQGLLTIGDDGLARAGTLNIATARNAVGVTYGSNVVTVTLDLGNNGSVDRTWTFDRATFNGGAG
jgi:hypothetical protein